MIFLAAADQKEFQISKTREGVTFDPNGRKWEIREGHVGQNFNFSYVEKFTSPGFVRGFKTTLVWYIENKSLWHAHNMFDRVGHLLRFLCNDRTEPLICISGIDLINYHSARPERRKWYLGSFSGFLKKWHALGREGVSEDAVSLLNEIKIKGNPKGVAVLTMDPNNGPFTDIELEAVQSALNKAHASGKIAKDAYILAWLFMLLGQRSVQYSLLKVIDVQAPRSKDGTAEYCLNVPRGKQRALSRTDFKERLITPQIGKLLYDYSREVQEVFKGKLEHPSQAPLFPSCTNDDQPPGMECHQESNSLRNLLRCTINKLKVRSERTGNFIHITSTRFRRTIGTRAAREGHGELVIAELLDHSDTQNVGVYVEATPEIIERIDKAMAMALAPMAQAFAGIMIADESDAVRGDDPASRIFDPRIERSCKTMGNCGSHGFCGFSAPIACYTCHSFQAWADGPHEAVLEHLLADRERKLKIADVRIASINDRTILAVAEVIRQCKEAKAVFEIESNDC